MNFNILKAYAFSFFWMFLVLIPVIVPYYQSLGLTMAQIFQLQAVFGISIVILEIPTGYLCDIWGRKNTLCLGAALSASAFSLLLVITTFKSLLAFEVALAAGTSLVSGADVSFLYDALEKDGKHHSHGTHALANMQLAQVSGESVASILGGILAAISFRHVIWTHALCAWIPFLIALTLKEPSEGRVKAGDHSKNLKGVARLIFVENDLLRLIFVNLTLWGLASFFAVWLFQKYWQDRGVPLAAFGYLWAGYNISVGIIGKQVHRMQRALGPLLLIVALALAAVAAYFGMAWSAGWAGIVFGLLFYLSRGITAVFLKEAFNRRIPSQFRATANSMQTFAFRGGFALVGPFVGMAVDHWGMTETLYSLGGAYLVIFFAVALPLGKRLSEPVPVGSLGI